MVTAADSLRQAGEPFLVATLVSVKGSSYRRPGARLLIAEDRWVAGSISGGCLERDLVRRAWWCLGDGQAALVSYDSTSDDDDLGWGIGLVTHGATVYLDGSDLRERMIAKELERLRAEARDRR